MRRTKYPAAMFSDMFNEHNENWLTYEQIWEFLNTDRIWDHLKLATDLGCTAVEGISDLLLEKFGDVLNEENPKYKRVKMMIGHMVKFVMDDHNYLPTDTVKCFKKTELFRYGMKYRKASTVIPDSSSNKSETFRDKMIDNIEHVVIK